MWIGAWDACDRHRRQIHATDAGGRCKRQMQAADTGRLESRCSHSTLQRTQRNDAQYAAECNDAAGGVDGYEYLAAVGDRNHIA